jgi:ribulose-phosphate 3-epimerase
LILLDIDTGRSGTVIVPSLLSADFSRLEQCLRAVERAGADMVSVDVMDGHFVPNLTFGPVIVSAVRKLTHLLVEAHLMVTNPIPFIPEFAKAGADYVSFHVEANGDLAETIQVVKESGARVGLAVKPETGLETVEHVLDQVDLLVVMTVNPGFGGQGFLHEMLPKIEKARVLREQRGWRYLIMIDGGIHEDTVPLAVSRGADLLVAGSAVFGSGDIEAAVRRLQEAAGRAQEPAGD